MSAIHGAGQFSHSPPSPSQVPPAVVQSDSVAVMHVPSRQQAAVAVGVVTMVTAAQSIEFGVLVDMLQSVKVALVLIEQTIPPPSRASLPEIVQLVMMMMVGLLWL